MKKPHIIFIDTDQQRADTIKATGSKWMHTPNFDQLATESSVFTKAFTMAATCGSNRASMYSGLYPHNLGVYGFDNYSGKFNWTHQLNAAGYSCLSIGKTHVCGDQHGYQQRIGEQHNKYQPWYVESSKEDSLWYRELLAAGHNLDLEMNKSIPNYYDNLAALPWSLPEEFHPDIWLGNKAVDILSQHDFSEPSFIHVGFMGPHEIYDPIERYLDLYDDDKIPMPEMSVAEREGMPEQLFESMKRYQTLENISSIRMSHVNETRVRRMRKHYYANVSMIDEQLGRIIQTLKERGIYENCLLILTSDHGDHLLDHSLAYKGELYDSIINVPLMIKKPQQAQSQMNHDLVSLLDAVKYMLEVAGAESENLDGISLKPVMEDHSAHSRKYVFAEEGKTSLRQAPDLLAMIRSHDYKLIYFHGGQTGQLFDLRNNPEETINHWDNPNYAQIKTELQSELLNWLYSNLYEQRNTFSEAR